MGNKMATNVAVLPEDLPTEVCKKVTTVDVLPGVLLTEVLVRVPVKTLGVCKLVSKPWLSLISNPTFIHAHVSYIIKNNNVPTLLNIVDSSKVNSSSNVVRNVHEEVNNVDALLHNVLEILMLIKILRDIYEQGLCRCHICFYRVTVPSAFHDSRVVGASCCNGIVCLTEGNVVYLWNPLIRRCKEVRVPELRNGAKIGFGYDSASNDYKVFRISCDRSLDSMPLKMQVYSAISDSWREFRGPVKLVEEEEFQQNNLIVVNGMVYFSNGDEQKLITFDLHKEVSGLVSFPSFVERKWSDVLDFKGSVAMVFESESKVNLWTLDDYISGQVSTWTKMFSIEVVDPELNMWLSCYLSAGQFYGKMLINGNFLYTVLYDCEKKETKYCGLREDNSLATLKYTETLVSLDGFYQPEDNIKLIQPHSRINLEDILP